MLKLALFYNFEDVEFNVNQNVSGYHHGAGPIKKLKKLWSRSVGHVSPTKWSSVFERTLLLSGQESSQKWPLEKDKIPIEKAFG